MDSVPTNNATIGLVNEGRLINHRPLGAQVRQTRSDTGSSLSAMNPFFIELQPSMVHTKSWVVLGRGVERFGPSSNGDTAAANALDDYEEGT